NADVSTTEFLSGDFFAHSNHTVILNDYLHRFIAPQRVYDHRNRCVGLPGGAENFGIEDDVSIEDNKTVAMQPIDCEPERINIVRDCERRILDEMNPLVITQFFVSQVSDNLFLLVANHYGNLIDSGHQECL